MHRGRDAGEAAGRSLHGVPCLGFGALCGWCNHLCLFEESLADMEPTCTDVDVGEASEEEREQGARLQHPRPEHLASPPLFIVPSGPRMRAVRGAPDLPLSPRLPGDARRAGAAAGTRQRRYAEDERAGGAGGDPADLDCLSPPAQGGRRRAGDGEDLGAGAMECGGTPLAGFPGRLPHAHTPRGGERSSYDRQTWEALMELGCAPTPRGAGRGSAFGTPGGNLDPSPSACAARAGAPRPPELLSPPLVYSGSARKRPFAEAALDEGDAEGRRGGGAGPDGTLFSPQPLVPKRARGDAGGGACSGAAGRSGGKCVRRGLGLGVGLRLDGASPLDHLVRPLCMSPPGLPGPAGGPAGSLRGTGGAGTPSGLSDLGNVRAPYSPCLPRAPGCPQVAGRSWSWHAQKRTVVMDEGFARCRACTGV